MTRTAPWAAVAAAVIVLAVAPAAARAQERHTIVIDFVPRAGAKSHAVTSDAEKQTLVMSKDGQVIRRQNKDEVYRFEEDRELLAVDGKFELEERRTFGTATHATGGGEARPLPVTGKTVVATRESADGEWSFAFGDGTPVPAEHVPACQKAWKGSNDGRGNPFDPKGPVAVGETWKPDMAIIQEAMFKGSPPGFLDAAKGEVKLVAAEKKDGVLRGIVEGKLSMPMAQLGPMKLETPFTFELGFRVEGCLDGTTPDASIEATIAIKGKSDVKTPQGVIEVDMDMSGKKTLRLEPR